MKVITVALGLALLVSGCAHQTRLDRWHRMMLHAREHHTACQHGAGVTSAVAIEDCFQQRLRAAPGTLGEETERWLAYRRALTQLMDDGKLSDNDAAALERAFREQLMRVLASQDDAEQRRRLAVGAALQGFGQGIQHAPRPDPDPIRVYHIGGRAFTCTTLGTFTGCH